MDLKELHDKFEELLSKEIELKGWIKNHRKQKEFGFIDFNDGTCQKNLQVVLISFLIAGFLFPPYLKSDHIY